VNPARPLTKDGHDLGRAVVLLAAWVFDFLPRIADNAPKRFAPPGGCSSSVKRLTPRWRAAARRVRVHIEDSMISVIVDDGEMRVIEGRPVAPPTWRSMSMRRRSSTCAWGALVDAMRYAKGSCDSWGAKRRFAATRAPFGGWMALGPCRCAPDDVEGPAHSFTCRGSREPDIRFDPHPPCRSPAADSALEPSARGKRIRYRPSLHGRTFSGAACGIASPWTSSHS
jgi:hypothetical protein